MMDLEKMFFSLFFHASFPCFFPSSDEKEEENLVLFLSLFFLRSRSHKEVEDLLEISFPLSLSFLLQPCLFAVHTSINYIKPKLLSYIVPESRAFSM